MQRPNVIHECLSFAQMEMLEKLMENEDFRFEPSSLKYEAEVEEHVAHVTVTILADGTRIPLSFHCRNAAVLGRAAIRERFSLMKINGKVWNIVDYLQRLAVVARAAAAMQRFMGNLPV